MTQPAPRARRRFRIREPFCGLSHGAGAVLSAVALVVLLVLARGRLWHTLGFAVFGISLILLYSASALYHCLPATTPRALERLQRFDYVAIFLLIAGTYAPICLVALRGSGAWGWGLLAAQYTLAGIGIGGVLLGRRRWRLPDGVRVALYVVMGWMCVIALGPLRAALDPAALGWLLAGGLAYSLGTVIFALDRPHLWPGRFSAHDLWHLFVLGGSACHFVLMCRFAA